MDFSLKKVMTMPIKQLWNSEGFINAQPKCYLSKSELSALLKKGRVEFVIANPGHILSWIPVEDCYSSWKSKIKEQVVVNVEEPINLDEYPNNFAYLASEWTSIGGLPIILLEMQH